MPNLSTGSLRVSGRSRTFSSSASTHNIVLHETFKVSSHLLPLSYGYCPFQLYQGARIITMAAAADSCLRPDVMEAQLSTVELIRAMYPPTEDGADSSTQDLLDRLREWCENPDAAIAQLPSRLAFTATIPIAVDDASVVPSPTIEMNITVPLTTTDHSLTEPASLNYSLRQPPWMSRAEVSELGASMPPDDIFAAFDYIQEHAPKYATKKSSLQQDNASQDATTTTTTINHGPLLRVWFYFPSLSTREKRKDLVSYAPRYRLTGFVLAGKPGVLCLEGTSRDVDGYMNAIKNESWGDIPSHQKKVSERFREACGPAGRRFVGMTEITDELGARRGARKNRGDMAALEAYLKEKGVGESFAKVVMGQ